MERVQVSKLSGKTAVVTGASKGIGADIAKGLAAEGAAVVVNYASSREGADKVVAEIVAAGGKALAVQADVSKPADITRLFAEAKAAFGALDILVNNAGVYQFGSLDAVTADEFHRQFNTNVLGLLLVTQEAARHFGADGGSVINISSGATSLNMPETSIYTATKASVDSITRVLAKELGARKIRVNAINPGVVETEGVQAMGLIGTEFEAALVSQTPLGRTGQPRDITPVAVFLASADAGWVTGEIIVASGGLR
jgi:3-oxoacyl-[acyl-carrier protein] reductase